MGFKESREETIAAIPWLGNERGIAFEGTLGARQDAELVRLKDAAKTVSGPFLCPDDALDKLGEDFGIERYLGEPNGTTTSGYRGRLCAAWPTRKLATTGPGIEGAFIGGGIPDAIVYAYEDFPTAEQWWSKIYLFLGPDYGTTGIAEQLWGTFTWGDPEMTWGSTAPPAQVAQFRAQFVKLKWAYALPVEIVLLFSGTSVSAISPVGAPTFTGAPPCVWRMAVLWGAPSTVWGQFTWQNGTW